MKRILLMDDNETMQTLLCQLLKLEGYEVLSSSLTLTHDLIHFIQDKKPETLILDARHAQVDSLALLKEIRSHSMLSALRVLIISGMDVRDRFLSAGADGFILKPFMPDEIFAWLNQPKSPERGLL